MTATTQTRPLPNPSQPLDKWTMRNLTWEQRQQARAARAAFLKAEKEQGNKHARTCQICARQIFAETGVIAHHGYQRPGTGWQTQSCEGARQPSFERSRDALGAYIERSKLALELMAEQLVKMQAETVPFRVEWQSKTTDNRGRHFTESELVTREQWDELVIRQPRIQWGRPGYSFDQLKSRNIATAEREIEHLRQHVAHQQGRFDAWVQVEPDPTTSPEGPGSSIEKEHRDTDGQHDSRGARPDECSLCRAQLETIREEIKKGDTEQAREAAGPMPLPTPAPQSAPGGPTFGLSDEEFELMGAAQRFASLLRFYAVSHWRDGLCLAVLATKGGYGSDLCSRKAEPGDVLCKRHRAMQQPLINRVAMGTGYTSPTLMHDRRAIEAGILTREETLAAERDRVGQETMDKVEAEAAELSRYTQAKPEVMRELKAMLAALTFTWTPERVQQTARLIAKIEGR